MTVKEAIEILMNSDLEWLYHLARMENYTGVPYSSYMEGYGQIGNKSNPEFIAIFNVFFKIFIKDNHLQKDEGLIFLAKYKQIGCLL